MNTKHFIVLFFLIVSGTLKAHADHMKKQELITIEESAKNFLAVLKEEEYQVLATQQSLFNDYEKLVATIYQIPLEILEQQTALYFAQALSKGANIYRRIASEKSLQLALLYHHKAIEIEQKISPGSVELAHSMVDLGATYNEMKGTENNKKAIEWYQHGLALYEIDALSNKRSIASTLHKLGNALRDLDENNRRHAIEHLDRALELFNQLPEDDYTLREKAKIFYNQGVNYHCLGSESNIKKAVEYLEKAHALFAHINDTARTAITLSYLGHVQTELGDGTIAQAIAHLQQALTAQETLFGNEHVEIAVTLHRLAMAHFALGEVNNLKNTLKYLTHALNIQKKLLSENHPKTAQTLADLEKCYLKARELGIVLPD
jgi:tetratricopeptide (TPR) repeat protein